MGGGVGLIDYDGDGWLDVYAVQGGRLPDEPEPPASPQRDRLFRNRGDGTFEDVTAASGLSAMPGGYGHGVTVGDIDNDGHADLFVTRWRSYALYRNRGDGTFEDATGSWGLGGSRDWPTSSALADLDGDGDLDLYVCHYSTWNPQSPPCAHATKPGAYSYCGPLSFAAMPDHVFRNEGGRFVDVSEQSGVRAADREGRGLGVLAAHLDDDDRIDLFVANDRTANFLFRNRGDLRFEETGAESGVASNAEGNYLAGMGVACGDLDGDGLLDLAVTNFYGESTIFYQNLGAGQFVDRTSAVGLAAPSRYLLGFGVALRGRRQRRPARPGDGQRPRQRPPAQRALRHAGATPVECGVGSPGGRVEPSGSGVVGAPAGARAGRRRPGQRRADRPGDRLGGRAAGLLPQPRPGGARAHAEARGPVAGFESGWGGGSGHGDLGGPSPGVPADRRRELPVGERRADPRRPGRGG